MNSFAQSVTDALSTLTVLTDLGVIMLIAFLILRKTGTGSELSEKTLAFAEKHAMLLSFLIAFGSMASSLFYSEIAGLVPCVLCWTQRIFLFPQAFILAVALWKKDARVRMYTLTLSLVGGAIALYHSYLQFGGSPLIPCSAAQTSVACSKVYFLEYGYVTIPTMALTAFAAIAVLAILAPHD